MNISNVIVLDGAERLDLDDFLKFRQGVLHLSFPLVHLSELRSGQHEGGIDGKRFLEMLPGVRVVFLLDEDTGQDHLRLFVTRIFVQGSPRLRGRSRQISLLQIGPGEVGPG